MTHVCSAIEHLHVTHFRDSQSSLSHEHLGFKSIFYYRKGPVSLSRSFVFETYPLTQKRTRTQEEFDPSPILKNASLCWYEGFVYEAERFRLLPLSSNWIQLWGLLYSVAFRFIRGLLTRIFCPVTSRAGLQEYAVLWVFSVGKQFSNGGKRIESEKARRWHQCCRQSP